MYTTKYELLERARHMGVRMWTCEHAACSRCHCLARAPPGPLPSPPPPPPQSTSCRWRSSPPDPLRSRQAHTPRSHPGPSALRGQWARSSSQDRYGGRCCTGCSPTLLSMSCTALRRSAHDTSLRHVQYRDRLRSLSVRLFLPSLS